MRRVSARARLVVLGIALVASGIAIALYAASAVGAMDAIGAIVPRLPFTSLSPLARGQQIYQASCVGCHGGPTGGTAADYPPGHNANGHTWQHPGCVLAEVVQMGQSAAIAPVPRATPPPAALAMPAFRDRLSDEEIADVLAFIKTMWRADQRASQERLTQEQCAPG